MKRLPLLALASLLITTLAASAQTPQRMIQEGVGTPAAA